MADYNSHFNGPEIDARLAKVQQIESDISGKADASALASVSSRVGTIEGKIPSDATSSNQLADKAFVNNGLSGKQATLVSGTNIKTVNNQSILGSGNLTAGDVFLGDVIETI